MPQTQQHSALSTRVAVPCARDTPAMEPRWRLLSVACLAALLGASGARAVVSLPDITTNITSTTTLPVVLNQGYWTDFSVECFNAGGNGGGSSLDCGAGNLQPDPNPTTQVGGSDALLFSWGGYNQTRLDPISGTVVALNSRLQVTYNGSQAFTLESLVLRSGIQSPPDNPPPVVEQLGPQGTFGDQPATRDWPVDQGQGTMLAYEVSGSQELLSVFDANPHHITDQLMAIRVIDDQGEVKAEVRDWLVARPESEAGVRNTTTDFFDGADPDNPQAGEGFPDYRFVGESGDPAEGKTFFFTDKGGADPLLDTRPTDTRTTVTIQPGYTLELQFYEAPGRWNNEISSTGAGDVLPPPDAYYGSFDLILNPAESEPEEPELDDPLSIPTLGSYGLGLLTLLMLVLGVAWRSRTA